MTTRDSQVAEGSALWHGRFAAGPNADLMAFTESIGFDQRLWADDIDGSHAHVTMLGATGILSADDVAAIKDALDTVRQEMSNGSFQFVSSDEDIHTAIERRVTQIAGDAGARLHTGRSRNDQVATALRLWSRREMRIVAEATMGLIDVLCYRASDADSCEPPLSLPGYTHLQRAQPVLLSHHLRAHAWSLLRDVDRIMDALDRADVSPLGAGALAGSSLPIDPHVSAEQLGFSRVFSNSLDAVSDRDFVAEYLFCLSLLAVHLSRMGEEWVLWTTEEFGFAVLDDAYSTGSSMLPQKKNADIAELARGKAGRMIGNLAGLLSTLKGLPLAYNRDLQEDKEPLFDSVDQCRRAAVALTGMIATARFSPDRMAAAASAELLVATDLAEWLVGRGVPFRDAHATVGQLVRESIETGRSLSQCVAAVPEWGAEAVLLFEPGVSLRRRSSPGAAGPDAAATQVAALAAARRTIGERMTSASHRSAST